ncbi:MAG: enoyl-CoA hydratase [SAR324 cluster bacterium]|nr:enoyl-CoA hydratase [SAR324 cluster bacterium]
MAYQEILYDVSDQIATITLNRPEKLNAWTTQMGREVPEAMNAAARDEAVRVIVLTGAGRGFCAGADVSLLSQAVEKPAEAARSPESGGNGGFAPANGRADFQHRYGYLPAIPKPIIAAINGPTAGLGLVIALYCDLRLASPDARLGTVFSRRGLIAEHGISWMLPRLVGLPHALDLLLSGRMVDAEEALRMGLVNRLLPAEGFAEAVRETARELASLSSPRSTSIIKKQLYEAQFQTLAEAIKTADVLMHESFTSDDFREGVAHFLEKRPPAFTGR